MLVLSSMDVWLLHNIISMFLWITFIGLVLLSIGFGLYIIDQIIDKYGNDNKNSKN